MSKVECVLLERTQQIAEKKGLLKAGEKINCHYTHICTGIRCLFLDESQYRTIYLKQTSTPKLISQTERFYNQLEKHFQKKHN
jgi:hypothetical protein